MRIWICRRRCVNVVRVVRAEHVMLSEEAERICVGAAGNRALRIDSTRISRILLSTPHFVALDELVKAVDLHPGHLGAPEAIVQNRDVRDGGLHENSLVTEFMDVIVLNRVVGSRTVNVDAVAWVAVGLSRDVESPKHPA